MSFCCFLLFGDSLFFFMKNLIFDWKHRRAWELALHSSLVLVCSHSYRLPVDRGGNCTYNGQKMQERRRLGETSLQPSCGRWGTAHLGGKLLGRPRKPSLAWTQLFIRSLFIERLPVSILVPWVSTFDYHNDPKWKVLLLHPFYRWRSWYTELVSCGARIWTLALRLQRPCSKCVPCSTIYKGDTFEMT